MVVWPECSHTDTFMLEYLGANSWNPEVKNRNAASFIDKFVADRYPSGTAVMRKIWQKFLPIIKMRGFVGPMQPHSFMIGENPFKVYDCFTWNVCGAPDTKAIYYQEKFVADFADAMKEMPALLKMLAKLDYSKMDEFTKRDVIDIARSCAGRCLHYGLYHLSGAFDKWRKNEGDKETVKRILAFVDFSYNILSDILAAHEDYSMNDTLKEMQTKHECNPDFEYTLKGNAENGYCRSYIYELVKPVYIPEFRIVAEAILDAMKKDNKGVIDKNDKKYAAKADKIVDKFYDTPLAKFKPDHAKAFKALPATLKKFADEVEKYMTGKTSSEDVDAFLKAAKL